MEAEREKKKRGKRKEMGVRRTWKKTKAEGRLFSGKEGHVLLNEDLHQVDVAACGRGMQGCPQLVVLGVHVRTVGKEQLDNFLEVVDAAL